MDEEKTKLMDRIELLEDAVDALIKMQEVDLTWASETHNRLFWFMTREKERECTSVH